MIRKLLFKITILFLTFMTINVFAEEYANDYIDIDVPEERIDEYTKYARSNDYNGMYVKTDSYGNVTTSSVNDTRYSSVDLGIVTSVKNQMSTGSCWAHAGMSVLETAAIKSGNATTDINLSEMHLVYGTHANAFSDIEMKNRFYLGGALSKNHNGGNIIMTASYLYSGLGAIKNELFPLKGGGSYGAGEVRPVGDDNREKQITSSEYASIDATPEFYINDYLGSYGRFGQCNESVNDIKKMILDYGSVQVSIYWASSYVHNSYYFANTAKNSTNHAVTLVGWDDSIEASKFGFSDETKKGAWIMKNSWGTNQGNQGYYYVSYYDNTVCGTVGTFDGIDNNKYDHVYDSTGMYYDSIIGQETSTDLYQASVFENKGIKEKLKKVAFAVNAGYSYKVYYAPYNNGLWKTDKSIWTNIGNISGNDVTYEGIKSLDVSAANVTIDEKYVIIVVGTKREDSENNLGIVTYKEKKYENGTISTMKMELIEDTNYYSIDGNTWTDLYDYGYSVSYSCDSDSDGEKDDTCTYNSKDYTEGAQNVIYAYTQDDINEVTIDSSIINSSNEIINNFYSFDDSKFKIDYSKLDKELETYYPTLLDTNNIDYTNLFDVNVDNTNKEILISKSDNSYIPVGTYKFTLYYDQDNSGEFDYQINSTLVVTKPFSINKIDVNTIHTDTTFNCLLKDYASTLTNDNLTYLIKLDSIDVTDKFNISYLSGSISISPKESIEKGTYNLSISINGNDIETINFEVHDIYTLNYTPSENELRITTNSTSHEYTINDLKNNVSSRYGYSILNSNDEEINPELIGTGMKLKLNTTATESIIYTFVVLGDTNGDGMISALDYVKIKNHIMEKNIISKEVFLKAADVNEDEKITALDYVRIKNYIMAGGN